MATIIETVERDSRTIAVYDNGMERDVGANRIIRGPTASLITAENSTVLLRRRWENYRRAAVKRIVGEAQSIDRDVSTGADAFALVASKQFVALMDYDKPRIDELEKLGEIMAGGKQDQPEQTPGALLSAVLGADIARSIAQIISDVIGAKQSAEIIDIKPD